jgi:chemotaxis signal transduction protein
MFLETDLQLVDISQVVEVVEVEDLLLTPVPMEQAELVEDHQE